MLLLAVRQIPSHETAGKTTEHATTKDVKMRRSQMSSSWNFLLWSCTLNVHLKHETSNEPGRRTTGYISINGQITSMFGWWYKKAA